MYTKGMILCKEHSCREADIEIDPCGTKGSIYALDHDGFTYSANKIETDNKIYDIEVYKCTPGKGCRFKILNTRNRK